MTINVGVCRINQMNNSQKPSETQTLTDAKPKLSPSNSLSSIKDIFVSTQNVIGLDIGTSYIKIVQLQRLRAGYLISNCMARAISTEIRNDPGRKKDLVKKFVEEFIADTNIKTKLCRLAISGRGVFIFSFLIPPLSQKDLRGAISIELKKSMPFQVDLGNIYFDYFITGKVRDDKGANLLQVTCIAAENLMINESVELIRHIGLRPIGINAIPDALGNLIPSCLAVKPEQVVAVLDIGANSSLINFYKQDTLQFFREIPIGGEHITQAMTKATTTPLGTISLTAKQAENIKSQCGIPLQGEENREYSTDSGMLLGSQISIMIRPILERLITELNRTFSYYTKTFQVPKIEGLYLIGGSSRLKNIEKFLLSNLEGIDRLERLNMLKAAQGWSDMSIFRQELLLEQAVSHLSVAFSVCLGNGGKVNLLPLKERLVQKVDFVLFLAKLFFPIILILAILFYTFNFIGTFRYKALIKKNQANINNTEPIVARIKEYLALKSNIDRRKSLLGKAVGRQPFWWGTLKELSIITPQGVVLNKIITTEGKTPLEIRLFGEILTKYTTVDLVLSQYLLALDESPFFSRVQLVSTQTDMYSAIPRAKFEVICQLSY